MGMLMLCIVMSAGAQGFRTYTDMIWLNYNQSLTLSDKRALVSDIQIRTRDWAGDWAQFAVRSGLQFRLNRHTTVTAGLAWFTTARRSGKNLMLPNEWRPWQEVAFTTSLRKWSLIQRVRTEQRFLQQIVNDKMTDEYAFRLRARYRLELSAPVTKHFAISAGNEVMLNLNHLGDSLCFDQNRLFITFQQQLSAALAVQFQYIRLHQWQAARNTRELQDVWRLSFHHQL